MKQQDVPIAAHLQLLLHPLRLLLARLIVCMPVPAAVGLNTPAAFTPGPLYVPPAGDPPVNVNAAALIHTEELAGQVTTCVDVTVIVNVQLLVQPVVALVNV